MKTCLSHQKGESPSHQDFGTRFAEYYRLLSSSLWFEHFLKLEVRRQFPTATRFSHRQYTPLQCVARVLGVEVLATAPTNDWLPVRVDLNVKGVGSGRIEARTGLRMMPTFPRSPLSAGRRVFPDTAGRLAYQAGPARYVLQVKPAPGMPC